MSWRNCCLIFFCVAVQLAGVGAAPPDSAIQRAAYWSHLGYNFDPTYMTAYSMDHKVVDIQRAAYWKAQGYDFNPQYMTAYSMDHKVVDIQRAAYWKTQGYNFDPTYTTAYSMDRKVQDIQRAAVSGSATASVNSTATTAPSFQSRASTPPSAGGTFPVSRSGSGVSSATSTTSSSGSGTSQQAGTWYQAPAGQAYLPPSVPGSTGGSQTTTSSSRYYDPTFRPAVGEHYVNSYVRSDGTYVSGHYQTNADGSFWNNWSSSGNVNPHTGKVGTKLPGGSGTGGGTEVRGYFKSNGTYVSPHSRSK